jgi:hypothetical protein
MNKYDTDVGIGFFFIFGMMMILLVKCTEGFEPTANARGREDELQRYENEEVICFSRRYEASNIFCKFK